jgi:hypothetical protein
MTKREKARQFLLDVLAVVACCAIAPSCIVTRIFVRDSFRESSMHARTYEGFQNAKTSSIIVPQREEHFLRLIT